MSDLPTVVLSDSSAGPGHEFNSISSGLRLPDGRILLANAGIPELALFESAGAFLGAVGRKGQGPGEWSGTVAIWPWLADSIAVYDAGVQRWTVLTPDLAPARTSPTPDSTFPMPTWLYAGAMIQDVPGRSIPAWVTAVLDSVRATDPEFSYLIHGVRDATGALWLQDPTRPEWWTIFSGPNLPPGAAIIPVALTPLQIGAIWVLALSRDSLDRESVSLFPLTSPSSPAMPDQPAVALPRDEDVRKALVGLVVDQEMHYAGHMTYAGRADSLRSSKPFGYPLFILGADKRHWAAVAVNPATGATCGISIGWPAPIGWIEGEPFCGR